MKRLLSIFLFLACFFIFSPSSLALTQFSTEYYITYQVQPDGNTHVKFDISQTNNLSQVYATDYSLSLSQTQVSNIAVTDIDTKISPAVNQTQNLTNISFPFIHKVVGKDKVHRFSIEYDTQDIAAQNGSTWEINIPQLEPKEDIVRQTVQLITPDDFPELAYINPTPNQTSGHTYTFTSHSLANQSISALFGTTQYYHLRLYYNLENTSSGKVNKEIALPPDTGYQQTYITQLSPSPTNINVDGDGNWLAQYQLEGKSNLQVTYTAFVRLNFQPHTALLPPQDFHTQSLFVWNYQDPTFTQFNLDNLTTARTIYDYVTQVLTYNYQRLDNNLSRPGASYALLHPNEVICTEFTDLFIALARKQFIPAREIQGYALSQNDLLRPLSLSRDVLHSWPEYYNSQTDTWIQVDPTWTDTTNGIDYFNKLDLNHITFVIHGQNPDYPLPAGAYKTSQSDSKDIYVEVASAVDFPSPQIQAEIISQTPKKITIKFHNSSGTAYHSDISISSPLLNQPSVHTLYLPPFSHYQLDIDLPLQLPRFGSQSPEITISDNQRSITLNTSVSTTNYLLFLVPLPLILFIIIYLFFRYRR